jgi:hypothetical protein
MDYGKAVNRRVLPGVVIAVVGFAGVLLLTAGRDIPTGASLSNASIPVGASFVNARLAGADLSNATLPGADFMGADLSGADGHNAVFSGGNFTAANLRGAKLSGASLDGVVWMHTICPDGENSDQVGNSYEAHLTLPAGSPGP